VAPLLEVRPVPDARLDLDEVCAIAFTSANAVAAFAALSPERGARVFAVGDATAAAARAAGFAGVLSAAGDVRALATALAARRRELTGVILNPTAAEPAADLAGALEAAGLRVRTTPLYETAPATLPPDFAARLAETGTVLAHSARAASVLAGLLTRHPAPHLTALALSAQVAEPLAGRGLAEVRIAAQPTEAALLALLGKPGAG
jgi:uroporphyrinogen-III synthase